MSELEKAIAKQESKVEERRKVLAAIVKHKGTGDGKPMIADNPDTEAIKKGHALQDYVDAKRDFETDQELLQMMKLKLITPVHPPPATPTQRNYEQVFSQYSPDKIKFASIEPSCFIADVPEGFELTSQNALMEILRKNPDVDIHADRGSLGRGETTMVMTLRPHDLLDKATPEMKPEFARIEHFCEFNDGRMTFRGEVHEGDNRRLTEIRGSLALDERMVIKLGPGQKERQRYLVLWFSYATHLENKSLEQMEKDREQALEWLGLLDGGDYAKAISAAIHDGGAFLGLNEVEWNAALTEIRQSRGAVISRVFKRSFGPIAIVGAQTGDYRLMQFETVFADGKKTVESVTFIKGLDFTWKVAAYFIR